jgi:Fe-S-cluster containining protein
MKHIVMFSGGVGSFMAAKRVVETYSAENTILLFTDTKMEDEDLYRFIAELIKLSDGRDVWQVFNDVKYLGNSRIAPCTRILKQNLAREWIENNYTYDDVVVYVGIDWTETHRMGKIKQKWEPYNIFAPLMNEPYISKNEIFMILENIGVAVPRLYSMGFSHNNCGGFCCKAGQGHFANLLEKMPERYAYHEKKEEEMREYLGKNVAILKKQRNNEFLPYTLKQLRKDLEQKDNQIDMFDIGGCGCFIEESRCQYVV